MTFAIRLLPWAAAGLALLSPGVAGAETKLPPCTGTCTPPVTDGLISDLEYANGIGVPLSNFATGGANGSLRLVLIGDILHVGLRVPAPVDSNRGEVKLFLDADRPGTSCSPVAEKPESEDRRLTVLYDLTGAGTASIGQLVGNGTGWGTPTGPLGFMRYWPTSMALARPAGDPGMIHLEVAITLRQANADESQVLADEELGFALHHLARGADEHMPGGAGQVPGVAAPCSWETLAFGVPEVVPLSIATWRLDGDYDPEDVAQIVAFRDVQCMVQVNEDSDKDDLIEEIDAIRKPLPGIIPVMHTWTWDSPVHTEDDPNVILSNLPVIASGSLEKQAVWARVLTHAAGTGEDGMAYDTGEFIDVFCLRERYDLIDVVAWMDSVRASDRPAIVMGYIVDESQLDLALTPFEHANEWLSDEHALEGDPDYDDFNTIFILPALDPWPTFGIAQEPEVVEDIHYDDDPDKIGDAENTAKIALVRTDEPGHWNPKKSHRLTYRVSRLVDHGSGGCCADWFTKAFGFAGGPSKAFSDDETPDGTDINPGWAIETTFSAGSVTASVEVWEWDTDGDDLYDATPEPIDWVPRFLITHLTGRIERINFLNQVVQNLGTFEANPDGMAIETKGTGDDHASAFHVFTAEEID